MNDLLVRSNVISYLSGRITWEQFNREVDVNKLEFCRSTVLSKRECELREHHPRTS